MRKYQQYSDLLKQIHIKHLQLKTVLYSNKLKNLNIGSTYSLLSTVLNNMNKFMQSKQHIEDKIKAKIQNQYLFYVLMGQYINTGKIIGGGKLKKIIIQNQNLLPKIEKNSKISKENIQIRLRKNTPEFNTWLTILNQYQKSSIDNVFKLKHEQYSAIIKDYPNILYNQSIVIQSESSSLPAYLLLHDINNSNINFKNFDIIDACAAPGNKTIQLAQYLGQLGIIHAFQKNQSRYKLLNKNIEKYHSKNIQSHHGDFLQTNPRQKQYKQCKMMLLDPSCSGSGMLSNFTRDNQLFKQYQQMDFETFCKTRYKQLSIDQKNRIEQLREFQLSVLMHASTFKPLRISYSTCSIYQRQNEDVVRQFLLNNPEYSIKKNELKLVEQNEYFYEGFGEKMKNCIRVDPRKRQTDGFFVCIFKRIKNKL